MEWILELNAVIYFTHIPQVFISFAPPMHWIFSGCLLLGILLGFLFLKKRNKPGLVMLSISMVLWCIFQEYQTKSRIREMGDAVIGYLVSEFTMLSLLLGILLGSLIYKIWTKVRHA